MAPGPNVTTPAHICQTGVVNLTPIHTFSMLLYSGTQSAPSLSHTAPASDLHYADNATASQQTWGIKMLITYTLN